MLHPTSTSRTRPSDGRQNRLAHVVRFAVAPVLLAMAGFVTADFALSGIYTWPRTSRILALTLTIVVLGYEFIYKEQIAGSVHDRLKPLVSSCLVPYVVGAVALVALARLAG